MAHTHSGMQAHGQHQHTAMPFSGCPSESFAVIKDVVYARNPEPHPRQKLDLYYPTPAPPSSQPLPVVVFVHGGAWKRGDKGDHYIFGHSHVGKSLARRGFVAAVVSYRLSKLSARDLVLSILWISALVAAALFGLYVVLAALHSGALSLFANLWFEQLVLSPYLPSGWQSALLCFAAVFAIVCVPAGLLLWLDEPRTKPTQYPGHVQDVAEAVRWVVDHAGEYGGDADSVYLVGHSAGGQLVSLLAFHESHLKYAGLQHGHIKGLVAVSGCYNIPRLYRHWLASRLYCAPAFGHSPVVHHDASPLTHVKPLPLPVLLVNAESDFYLHEDTAEMLESLQRNGIAVQHHLVRGKNHRSIMFTRDLVADLVSRFVKQHQLKQSTIASPSPPQFDGANQHE